MRRKLSIHNIIKVFLVIFLFGLPAVSFAQEEPDQAITTPTEAPLEKRVSKLEKILEKLPDISGYVNLRYFYEDLDGARNSFQVRRANVTLKGNITPSFEYLAQVGFASSPQLIDAYAKWTIREWFAVQGGQFKIPFSLELLKTGLPLEVTESAAVITHLTPYSEEAGIRSSGRDIGIMFSGRLFPCNGFHRLEYQLALLNGAGRNVNDNNRAKDFSGRLFFHASPYLKFSISHYNGRYGENGHLRKRIRSAAGFQYEDSNWIARVEYIQGNTGGMKGEGYYGLLGYRVYKGLQPIVRYDGYFRDKKDHSSRIDNYTIGITYYVKGLNRVQLNYIYSDHSSGQHSNLINLEVWAVF